MDDLDASPTGQRPDTGSPKTSHHETTDVQPPNAALSTPEKNDRALTGSPNVRKKGKSDTRPRTAPNAQGSNARRKWGFLEEDFKRDSGIAPSTKTDAPEADNHNPNSPERSLVHTPSLPIIVVHDADSSRLPTLERIISPFTKKRSHDTRASKSTELQRPATAHQRMPSFHGIETDIPTGGLEDFNSDKIDFSKRGSLMFGGKKMGQLIAAQGDKPIDDGIVEATPASEDKKEEVAEEQPAAQQSPKPRDEPLDSAITNEDAETACDPGSPRPLAEQPQRKSGLVAGRRKPSVQMLQAAISGGRVLSAEEITFSMRVRSMYEHGDENAADWTSTPLGGNSRVASPELYRDTPEPTGSIEGLVVDRTREIDGQHGTRNPEDIRAQYTKAPNEVAGGMENWEDLDGAEVDRFGFISPTRILSHDSGMPTMDGSMGLHRVATGLRLVSDQPRRERSMIRRKASTVRSSRSAPPGKNSSGASMRSFQTNRSGPSRTGRFRSRDRRVLDEASNMLTLPQGLADIAEHQDGVTIADYSQRKEWSRNEKWLQMARKRSDSKGGGTSFDFDTTNPKLIKRTWKGIPDRWRAAAWHSFLSASARRRGPHTPDEELIQNFHHLQDLNCADDVQIDVDVPRTISMHIMFRKRYRGGQRLLFRVLHAIALYCPDTGYVQGMASLAATLLCYFDEERAFVMLVRLWQLRGLEQLFRSGFDGLMAALQEFEDEWLRGGDVAARLNELGISSTAYGTRWYLTLFNMSVPFPAQLRVWDTFMLLETCHLVLLPRLAKHSPARIWMCCMLHLPR
ncbi:hypothetical protein Q7P37_010006 [Cladosporium fusiforme]